jgi:hypothetical protein
MKIFRNKWNSLIEYLKSVNFPVAGGRMKAKNLTSKGIKLNEILNFKLYPDPAQLFHSAMKQWPKKHKNIFWRRGKIRCRKARE